jgi:hypothetical protein
LRGEKERVQGRECTYINDAYTMLSLWGGLFGPWRLRGLVYCVQRAGVSPNEITLKTDTSTSVPAGVGGSRFVVLRGGARLGDWTERLGGAMN